MELDQISINYYSHFQENYTESHWHQLKRILRCLRGTIDMIILFPKNMKLEIIAYAASDKERSF